MKPNPLAKLRVGKLIDTCHNFVATFNWMARLLYYFKTDDWLKLDVTPDDKATLKFNASGDSASVDVADRDIDTVKSRVFTLHGFDAASDGKFAVKRDGALAWEDAGGGPSTLDVITDIQFSFDGGALKATLTRKRLMAVTLEDVAALSRNVASVAQKSVVVNNEYNADGDYAFKQKKVAAYVMYAGTSSESTTTVFETTLHT